MAKFADTHDPGPLRRSAAFDEGTTTDDTALGETLRHLKRSGCSLLVTGSVPFETRAAMSRRLFGAADERRYRLLAVTNSVGLPVERYLPSGVPASSDSVSVVDFADELRGVTVAGTTADTEAVGDAGGSTTAPASPTGQDAPGSPGPTMRTDDADRMAAFGTSVETAVERLADRVGPFAPGELRVGVASLSGPFDDPGVGSTVASLVEDVVGRNGMIHCHALGPRSNVGSALSDPFDVRIELRDRGTGVPEHRWVVPDRSVRTGWVPL